MRPIAATAALCLSLITTSAAGQGMGPMQPMAASVDRSGFCRGVAGQFIGAAAAGQVVNRNAATDPYALPARLLHGMVRAVRDLRLVDARTFRQMPNVVALLACHVTGELEDGTRIAGTIVVETTTLGLVTSWVSD